ncbi:hypothetical protein GCM10022215_30480 [Nocardioides fonticola]|uniref:Uncharacterized protein n=1 Tax=Nocardioides fonticola TaxID=450363 RepID=A0ABP7XPX2_9ACTN
MQVLLHARERRRVNRRYRVARVLLPLGRGVSGRRRMVDEAQVRGPHPHGVGDAVRAGRAGRQVGARGVAEVAEPLGVGRPVGQFRLQDGEDVVADDRAASARVPGDLVAGRVVGEGDVVGLQPAEDRASS